MKVFSAARQIKSPQDLRVHITIFPSVSGDNAASGRIRFNALCVHPRDIAWTVPRRNMRESAKVGDKVKTAQCVGPVNDISESM